MNGLVATKFALEIGTRLIVCATKKHRIVKDALEASSFAVGIHSVMPMNGGTRIY